MEIPELRSAIEAMLFAAGNPLSLERISEILEVEEETVSHLIQDLSDDYRFNRRGLRVLRLDESYQLSSAPEFAEAVKKALGIKKPPPMSKASLEILSIIAYYQPVTRAYIDQIRGVDSSYTVGLLVERGLIEDCGFLEVPGRPRLFRTTAGFLRTFGISSVEELPELPDLSGETEGQMTLLETLPASGEEEDTDNEAETPSESEIDKEIEKSAEELTGDFEVEEEKPEESAETHEVTLAEQVGSEAADEEQ